MRGEEAQIPAKMPTSGPYQDNGDPVWQQDFPINRSEELNNSRRQFLKFLGRTSLAFFTGTLGVALKGALDQQQTEELPQMRVASVSDVPEGASLNFEYRQGGYPAAWW